MLQVAPEGDVSGAVPVTAEEDRLLRAAFGRYGGQAEARAAAAVVVARYQQAGSGRWFLCGCRPAAERPPALVPVSQTHIRRHEDGRWPLHGEACDFYREPEEQRAVTASYAPPAVDKPLRLARPLGRVAGPAHEARIETCSRHTSWPGLARLLTRLVTDAGLQAIPPGWQPPPLGEQVKALWAAARAVEIDAGVRLSDFLCTSPSRLRELMTRVEAAPAKAFTRTRPHGMLIVRAAAVGDGVVQPVSGEPIRVRGRLAVFGERAEPGRETRAERGARAPYLVAALVGRALEGEPVEVLSAYAHPCAGDAHLMLLDSGMERRTLAQLRSVQAWLAAKHGVAVGIEKPLFDMGPVVPADTVPRPPLIPDFVLRAGAEGEAVRTVVAETMGFADQDYRTRKALMHPLMSAVLGGASVVEHDFHNPLGSMQMQRDKTFWLGVRWALAPAQTPAPPRPHPPARRLPGQNGADREVGAEAP